MCVANNNISKVMVVTSYNWCDRYINTYCACVNSLECRVILVDSFGVIIHFLQAHRHRKIAMTGSAYVWILPQFYDPHWWSLSNNSISKLRPSQRCSNKEIEEILNTTHVISVGVHHHRLRGVDPELNQTVPIVRSDKKCVVLGVVELYICFVATPSDSYTYYNSGAPLDTPELRTPL